MTLSCAWILTWTQREAFPEVSLVSLNQAGVFPPCPCPPLPPAHEVRGCSILPCPLLPTALAIPAGPGTSTAKRHPLSVTLRDHPKGPHMQFTHLKAGALESGRDFLLLYPQRWGLGCVRARGAQIQLHLSPSKSWLCCDSLSNGQAHPIQAEVSLSVY